MRLVRVIDRLRFSSPRNATRELEFHIQNDTERAFPFIYLPLKDRVQNLRVHDDNGNRLSIASAHEVAEGLEELKKANPDAHSKLILRFKHTRMVLVLFPPSAHLAPYSARIITFKFDHDDTIRGKKWTLFTLPEFSVEETQYPGHAHSYQVVVAAPQGLVVNWKKTVSGQPPNEKCVAEYGVKGKGRTFTVRMAPAEKIAYTCHVDFFFTPASTWTARGLATFWWVGTLVGLLGLALRISTLGVDPTVLGNVLTTLSGGITASCVAMLTGIREEWTERYKLLLFAPISINAAAWFAWAFA